MVAPVNNSQTQQFAPQTDVIKKMDEIPPPASDPAAKLQATMDRALAQQAAMQAMTIDFQSRTEALKAISEAMNAGHEAKMDTLDKVGRAAG